jgi:hypothetical protein
MDAYRFLRFPCYLLTVSLLSQNRSLLISVTKFRLKPAWIAALLVMPSSFGAEIFDFPCIFPCYQREFCLETGSYQTASSATQSGLCGFRLSKRANAVRLQLRALAYNLGNFLRTLATPEPIKDWSLTSLKDKLIKIGAKVVSHAAMLSSRWPRSPSHGKCSRRFCGSSRNCGRSHHQRRREAFDGYAFKSSKWEECAPNARKMARSGSRKPLG